MRDPRSLTVIGLAAAAIGVLLLAWLRPVATLPVEAREIALDADAPGDMAIAPDGSAIVYHSGTHIMLQERDRFTPVQLATVNNTAGPAFSPDGRGIAFLVDGKLERVARSGGAPVVISDSNMVVSTAWLDDDTILSISTDTKTILATPASGGPTRRVFEADSAGDAFDRLTAVPGTIAALATISGPHARMVALDLRTGTTRVVRPGLAYGWVVDNQLVYVERGTLYTMPFNARGLAATGTPVPVLDSVGMTRNFADLQIGRNGTLIFRRGPAVASVGRAHLVRVSLDGSVARINPEWTFAAPGFGGLDLSPDGERVAVTVGDSASGVDEVWVIDVRGRAPVRLTFQGGARPAWSPDGQRVMYATSTGLWEKRADGSGPATLAVRESRPIIGGEWSRDGQWIAYRTDNQSAGRGDIVAVRTKGDTTRVPLAATQASEVSPALSPDGRWLAYSSDVSGRQEVYVQPFPEAGGTIWQVSLEGGSDARWSHSGQRLFYVDAAGRVTAADVRTSPTFAVAQRRPLFSLAGPNAGLGLNGVWFHAYAVTPDDRYFVTLEADQKHRSNSAPGRLIEIDHWRPRSGVRLNR